ncbi:helix-turn-helix domain-containing protein [Paraburkholderia sediminicola]|uniref:helix-turn-helix domain-containing protein n=1 Tax=Paraburkholderia sediminicola TaxID=458836 RepID=UPI0038B8D080
MPPPQCSRYWRRWALRPHRERYREPTSGICSASSLREGAKREELCQRYGISTKTGYRWLNRNRQSGEAKL